jgi:hypothetical protein
LITGRPIVTLVPSNAGKRGAQIPAQELVNAQKQYEEVKKQELERWRERDPAYKANKDKFFSGNF